MSLSPQFFDIFGAIAFIYITLFALWVLFGNTAPKWAVVLLLVAGVLGLIVDAFFVYKYFISK